MSDLCVLCVCLYVHISVTKSPSPPVVAANMTEPVTHTSVAQKLRAKQLAHMRFGSSQKLRDMLREVHNTASLANMRVSNGISSRKDMEPL